MKRTVTEFGRDEDLQIFQVNEPSSVRRVADVWWYENEKRARCTYCSTLLRGMSSSCPHAAAVRRMMLKNEATKCQPTANA